MYVRVCVGMVRLTTDWDGGEERLSCEEMENLSAWSQDGDDLVLERNVHHEQHEENESDHKQAPRSRLLLNQRHEFVHTVKEGPTRSPEQRLLIHSPSLFCFCDWLIGHVSSPKKNCNPPRVEKLSKCDVLADPVLPQRHCAPVRAQDIRVRGTVVFKKEENSVSASASSWCLLATNASYFAATPNNR